MTAIAQEYEHFSGFAAFRGSASRFRSGSFCGAGRQILPVRV
jgi:hypothetical protein